MFGIRTRRLEISKLAHDAALDYLTRAHEHSLSDELRSQLIQVVIGHNGRCDTTLARAGLEWMREQARRRGKRATF
jgi:hypothetical protein